MGIEFLLDVFRQKSDQDAIVWNGRTFRYGELLGLVENWRRRLADEGVAPGSVVSIEADFSPTSIAALLALIERSCTLVPLTDSVESKKPEFLRISQVERRVVVAGGASASFLSTGIVADHAYLARIKASGHPGLILFSSGSTGESKAAVHDLVPLLEKFQTRRHAKRMLTFLLFDHIGGINTLFYTLSNGGCIVTVPGRSPDEVAAAIEKHSVQVLPTSPTFINLLLMSEAYRRHDLSSLELVTYGTEPMSQSRLARFHELFPKVVLQQTYGLSELGILRSKSKSSDTLWVKVGGEDFETRVVDGLLEIRAKSAMLGYLNAESPFTEDGWFKTGDMVEVDGEYLKILGRKSDLINVGGKKVYPAEVESVLQLMPGVQDVSVRGEANPIVGAIVCALVLLDTGETIEQFRIRMRQFCKDKMDGFKIPQKVELSQAPLHSARFKKTRGAATSKPSGGTR